MKRRALLTTRRRLARAVLAGVLTVAVAGCTATAPSSSPTTALPPVVASVSAAPTTAATAATNRVGTITGLSTGRPGQSARPTADRSTSRAPTVRPTPRRGSPPVTVISTTTVTRTKPGVTTTVGPPRATAEPTPTTGVCPYLSADVVSEITGQHHGQTQLVQFDPHPMCVFYRSDGVRLGSVRVVQAASAAAAAAAVDQHVPIAGSQPASQPAGWTGGSSTTPGQMTQDSTAMSVYAVSKGNIAVVAEEDESPSLKARLMAVCAIYGLGLQAERTPDYCDPDQ